MATEHPARPSLNKRLRSVVAAWAIASAMISPLLGGYRFLSAHTGLAPVAPTSVGAVTILVNLFQVTLLVTVMALFVAAGLTVLASRQKRLWSRIAKAALLLLLSLILLLNGAYLWTIAFLVPAVVSLTPFAWWLDTNCEQATVMTAIGVTICIFLTPGWLDYIWKDHAGGKSGFTIVPLSAMTVGDWINAAGGAAIYVGAYVAFKEWQTDGGWLKDVRARVGF